MPEPLANHWNSALFRSCPGKGAPCRCSHSRFPFMWDVPKNTAPSCLCRRLNTSGATGTDPSRRFLCCRHTLDMICSKPASKGSKVLKLTRCPSHASKQGSTGTLRFMSSLRSCSPLCLLTPSFGFVSPGKGFPVTSCSKKPTLHLQGEERNPHFSLNLLM